MTLIADYFVDVERQKFIGVQVAFMSLGGILFLGLGGLLADIGWRYPFLIYLLSLLIFPIALYYLQVRAKKKKVPFSKLDVKTPKIIWFLFFNTLIIWIFFFLIPVQLPFYLKNLGIDRNVFIGIAIATSTLFSAVTSFYFSSIIKLINSNQIFLVGYLMLAYGFILLSMANFYIIVCASMVLVGLGMGLMIPNTNMLIMKKAPIDQRGKQIGRLTSFWFFGQFMSPVLFFPISKHLSYSSIFMFSGILLLIYSIIFIFIDKLFPPSS